MPSEQIPVTPHDQVQQDQAQSQIKHCSACHSPLSSDVPNTPPFILRDAPDASDAAVVCSSCRSRLALCAEPPLRTRDGLFAEVERELLRRAASLQDGCNEATALQLSPRPHVSHTPSDPCPDEDMESEAPAPAQAPSTTVDAATPSALSPLQSAATPEGQQPQIPLASTRPTLTAIDTHDLHPSIPSSPRALQPVVNPTVIASGSKPRWQASPASSPDPLVDITRLRVRSQGHHCLYPGATFQGTQKSGRNSYDVNVTIVDVDFSSSHLCGYLRIRGLTDDWPELTTYFDAEIIGSRYGFLTRNWGASEQEDMVHWARFPAFRHVRHDLKKPHLTMKDTSRGAVFMRWKEKFLVPDHRVQDINGASFAGFYYVCVDFNPQQSGTASTQPLPSPVEEVSPAPAAPAQSPNQTKTEPASRARRTSVSHGTRRTGRSSSRSAPSNVATMSGFYFHQNSEPYQQLSLVHVPERTTSCFEFR
ncbi:vacuolar import and degradation protein-domain-containing protein [Amylocystis lapponica]|nr:vacuolar import and degradation protein-domain-containing protein [Amylocystis lapponica]